LLQYIVLGKMYESHNRPLYSVGYLLCLSFLRYIVMVLSALGDGEKVGDQIIVDWVNTTLKDKRKDTQIKSFKVCEQQHAVFEKA